MNSAQVAFGFSLRIATTRSPILRAAVSTPWAPWAIDPAFEASCTPLAALPIPADIRIPTILPQRSPKPYSSISSCFWRSSSSGVAPSLAMSANTSAASSNWAATAGESWGGLPWSPCWRHWSQITASAIDISVRPMFLTIPQDPMPTRLPTYP
jgi:hypothetical protein